MRSSGIYVIINSTLKFIQSTIITDTVITEIGPEINRDH